MLILEIAAGIVLAVLFFAFFEQILALGVIALIIGLAGIFLFVAASFIPRDKPVEQRPSQIIQTVAPTKPTTSQPPAKTPPAKTPPLEKPNTTAKIIGACLLQSAEIYKVPPAVLIGIMHLAGGRNGQQVLNPDGSYSLGVSQISSRWMPQLASLWNIDNQTAFTWVRDNGCVNMHVMAWILRQKIDENYGLFGGIAAYGSNDKTEGWKYADNVIKIMKQKGLSASGLQDRQEAYTPMTQGSASMPPITCTAEGCSR